MAFFMKSEFRIKTKVFVDVFIKRGSLKSTWFLSEHSRACHQHKREFLNNK